MMGKLIIVSGASDKEISEQLSVCNAHLANRWDVDFNDAIIKEIVEKLRHCTRTEIGSSTDTPLVHVISNRPDLDRSDHSKRSYEDWLRSYMHGDRVDEVIVRSTSEINPGTVIEILANTPTITIADAGISYRRGVGLDDVQRTHAVVTDAQTTDDGAEIIKQDWPGGRPPIGTAVDSGRLIKAEEFNEVRNTLQMVQFDELSKSAAADRIGCTRKTISNSIENRAEMYELPRA